MFNGSNGERMWIGYEIELKAKEENGTKGDKKIVNIVYTSWFDISKRDKIEKISMSVKLEWIWRKKNYTESYNSSSRMTTIEIVVTFVIGEKKPSFVFHDDFCLRKQKSFHIFMIIFMSKLLKALAFRVLYRWEYYNTQKHTQIDVFEKLKHIISTHNAIDNIYRKHIFRLRIANMVAILLFVLIHLKKLETGVGFLKFNFSIQWHFNSDAQYCFVFHSTKVF